MPPEQQQNPGGLTQSPTPPCCRASATAGSPCRRGEAQRCEGLAPGWGVMVQEPGVLCLSSPHCLRPCEGVTGSPRLVSAQLVHSQLLVGSLLHLLQRLWNSHVTDSVMGEMAVPTPASPCPNPWNL